MGDYNPHQQWNAGGVHHIVPKFAAVYRILVPRDSVQQVRNQQPYVQRQGDRDAFQVVPGVWVPPAPAVLPPHVVYGRAGGSLRHHHYHGHRNTLCQEQEL